jgi:hypothetical protein
LPFILHKRQTTVYALIDAEHAGTITDEERAELDSCIRQAPAHHPRP